MVATTLPLVLITGANQGIGLAAAKALASKDHSYHVILAGRNFEAVQKEVAGIRESGGEATALKLDLMSKTSIEEAVASVERDFGYLDVLVNNAGILLETRSEVSTWDLYQKTFGTNAIGAGYFTEGLLPLLRKAKSGPPRLVFVSSIMGSVQTATDKTTMWYPIDYRVYDASKAAMNMLAINFNRILDGTGAKVNVVCPGLVKSNLTQYMDWATSPETGAKHVVTMATLGEDGPTCTFSNAEKELPW